MKEERWGKAFWHDSGGFSGGDGAHKRPPVLFPLQGAYFYDEIWMLVQKRVCMASAECQSNLCKIDKKGVC